MNTQFEWRQIKLHDPDVAMFSGKELINQFSINMLKSLDGWDCRLIRHEETRYQGKLEPGKRIVVKEFHAKSKEDAKLKANSVVYDFISTK